MSRISEELGPTLRLAGPVVLAELGWMAMGTVDTMMVGHVGRDALAGAATGNALFHFVVLLGIGVMLGLDTLIAQAFGAGNLADCDHSLRQGCWLAVLLTPPLMAMTALIPPMMRGWGVTEEVYEQATLYLYAVNWSTLPLLLYAAFRRYLQALTHLRIIMFALLSANLVNAFGNWVLIYGNLGAPAMGAEGSAWATTFSSIYMAGVLIAYTAVRQRALRGPWRFDMPRVREIVGLGAPAAGQIGLEVGVFSLAAVIAATLSTLSAAAHQIAINTAGLTFMVPLGVSSAGAVRVGHAIGAGDGPRARAAGWSAMIIGVSFMALAGAAMFLVPEAILRIYTSDATLIATGKILLYIAAVFQLFDGLQVVSTGILRGAGDTRTPMWANLGGHWLIGLPVGYWLCFGGGMGVYGLWSGLCIGLITVAVALMLAWRRRSKRFVEP